MRASLRHAWASVLNWASTTARCANSSEIEWDNLNCRCRVPGLWRHYTRTFLEWIGKAVPDGLQKTYSGDQLAALSKLLSSETIQELVQFGLLDERGGSFGFRDLASARQIAKLLTDGVRISSLCRQPGSSIATPSRAKLFHEEPDAESAHPDRRVSPALADDLLWLQCSRVRMARRQHSLRAWRQIGPAHGRSLANTGPRNSPTSTHGGERLATRLFNARSLGRCTGKHQVGVELGVRNPLPIQANEQSC